MSTTVSTSTRLVAADYQVVPIFINLADITAAGTFFKFTPGKPGKIVSLDFCTAKAATTASKLATVTPAIGGTALAGCVVELTTAKCDSIGEKTAGSAAPASGNVFDSDDEVQLVSSAVTAFAEGSGYFLLGLEFGTQN
jgi:hypothetical protein